MLIFIFLYCITTAIGITGVAYAFHCGKYSDWAKNFLLATVLPLGMMVCGSVIHRDPEKKPFSYLLWFVRFVMVWYTINLAIDTYHISGGQCGRYGATPPNSGDTSD